MGTQLLSGALFGQCKCCLNETYLKNMWKPLNTNEEWEVYGEMLVDCFGVEWMTQKIEDDNICQVCISKLRVSVAFKKQVQDSQAALLFNTQDEVNNSNKTKQIEISQEQQKPVTFMLQEVRTSAKTPLRKPVKILKEKGVLVKNVTKKEENENDFNQDEEEEEDSSDNETGFIITNGDKNYEDVEFLEDDVLEGEVGEDDDHEYEPVKKKTRAPSQRNHQYKRYSEEDLTNAIEAVKSNKMSRLKAAEMFNVPRKTISTKLYTECDEGDEDIEQKTPEPEYGMEILLNQHRENILTILEHSNATPIKGHWGSGYACYFCPQQFEKPSQLKEHTLTHGNPTAIKVKSLMDHVVKLDVTLLQCNICASDLPSLDDLMLHLKENHDMGMNLDIPNHIVPFSFEGDSLECVKCRQQFDSFKHLSDHMNDSHYRNYECEKCYRGFVNLRLLKTHSIQHGVGIFVCTYCPSFFNSRELLDDHVDGSHLKRKGTVRNSSSVYTIKDTFKCGRQTEMVAQNETRVCKECSKVFNSESSLNSHINLVHHKHKCQECGSAFDFKFELKRHEHKWHTSRTFQSSKCPKKCVSKDILEKHVQEHEEVKGYSCEVCCSQFTEEDCYMEHMKNEHGLE